MTAFADHQGLALAHGHRVFPLWPFRTSRLIEIGEFADVVDLQSLASLADLALPGQEPVNQLVSPGSGHDGLAVADDSFALSLERDPAEAGNQWLLPLFTVHRDLEARPPAVRSVHGRLVLAGHLRNGRLVLAGQGLEHRGLHDPAQRSQT